MRWALRFGAAGLCASLVVVSVIGVNINWHELDAMAQVLPTADAGDELGLILKDKNGRVLQARDVAREQTLDLSTLPKHVVQSFLAAEDRTFYSHHGVNPLAFLRALVANVRARRFEQGASTITQQVARISYLTPDKSIWRKIHELALAVMIERYHSKQDILSRYLQHVYLGQGAYGVEEAAWVYFGKRAKELTIGQSALIAGLAPAPSKYNPMKNRMIALQRRDLVLGRMQEAKFISARQAASQRKDTLYFAGKKPHLDPTFAFIQQQVLRELNSSLAVRGDKVKELRVTTSLDLGWQKAATRWDRFIQPRLAKGCEGECESAFVAVDTKTGQLLGFTGSKDFKRSQFNRGLKMQRAMGQMVLPFIIGSSFENGGNWLQTFGVKMGAQGAQNAQAIVEPTLMDALRGRLQAESMRLLYVNGVGTWQHFLGRYSQLWETSAMNTALGMESVSPVAMARLYAGLLTPHEFGELSVVQDVVDSRGKLLLSKSDESAPEVIPYHVRRLVAEGMRQNLALAAGNGKRSVGSYTGYSGFSVTGHDVWFVFATQETVAVGWLGDDKGRHRLGQEAMAIEDYQTIDRIWLDFAAQLPQQPSTVPTRVKPNQAKDIAMVPYTTIWGESMRVPTIVRVVSRAERALGVENLPQ